MARNDAVVRVPAAAVVDEPVSFLAEEQEETQKDDNASSSSVKRRETRTTSELKKSEYRDAAAGLATCRGYRTNDRKGSSQPDRLPGLARSLSPRSGRDCGERAHQS